MARRQNPHDKVFPLKSDSKFPRYAGAQCVLCGKGANNSAYKLKGQPVCDKCGAIKCPKSVNIGVMDCNSLTPQTVNMVIHWDKNTKEVFDENDTLLGYAELIDGNLVGIEKP